MRAEDLERSDQPDKPRPRRADYLEQDALDAHAHGEDEGRDREDALVGTSARAPAAHLQAEEPSEHEPAPGDD